MGNFFGIEGYERGESDMEWDSIANLADSTQRLTLHTTNPEGDTESECVCA